MVMDTLFDPCKRTYPLCHAFIIAVHPYGSPHREVTERGLKYWKGWFGQQRGEDGGHAKGIVKVIVEGSGGDPDGDAGGVDS